MRNTVIKKLNKLSQEYLDLYKKQIEAEDELYQSQQKISKLITRVNKKEKELLTYFKEKSVTEEEYYKCELLGDIYDMHYDKFIEDLE